MPGPAVHLPQHCAAPAKWPCTCCYCSPAPPAFPAALCGGQPGPRRQPMEQGAPAAQPVAGCLQAGSATAAGERCFSASSQLRVLWPGLPCIQVYDASAEEEEGATPNFQLVTEQSELSRGLGRCGSWAEACLLGPWLRRGCPRHAGVLHAYCLQGAPWVLMSHLSPPPCPSPASRSPLLGGAARQLWRLREPGAGA